MRASLKFVLIVLASLSVTACGDSDDMKKVKEHVFEYIDSSRTLGTAMEKRSACDNSSWDEQEDVSGRNLIIFSCDINAEAINATFERINENYKNEFEEKIAGLKKHDELMNRQVSKLDEVATVVRGRIPDVVKINAGLSNKQFYDKTPEETESDDVLSKQRSAIEQEATGKANVIMEGADFFARDTAEKMVGLLGYIPFQENENIAQSIESGLKRIALEYKESFNLESELVKVQKNVERFKESPIAISDMRSVMTFSANPSVENPVSVISSVYSFKNNGRDYTSGGGVGLKDMYNGDEVFKLKGSVSELYMQATGVMFIPYSALKE